MKVELKSTKARRTVNVADFDAAIAAAHYMERELRPTFGVDVWIDGSRVATVEDGRAEINGALFGFRAATTGGQPAWFHSRQAAGAFAVACGWGNAAVEQVSEDDVDASDVMDVPGRPWEPDAVPATPTAPPTRWRVFHGVNDRDFEFCGEFETLDEAESATSGLPKYLWETARAAGHCDGLTAPDPRGEEAEEVESWHGDNYYVVRVTYPI